MSFPFYITSEGSNNGSSSNFTIKLERPLNLEDYEVSLVSARLWNSYHNFSSSLGNNQFRYYDSTNWTTITIPNGQYNVSDLNAYISRILHDNGDFIVDSNGTEQYAFQIYPNTSTLRCVLEFGSDSSFNLYKVDFTISGIYKTLGFSGTQEYAAATSAYNEGDTVVDITNGITDFYIVCDVVDNALVNGLPSNVLHSFNMTVPAGFLINIEPNFNRWVPVKSGQIREINVKITDQLFRVVDFNNEPISLALYFRPRPKLHLLADLMESFTSKFEIILNRIR